MIPHPVQPGIAASPWLTQIAMLNVRRPAAVDHSPENWRRKPRGPSLAKSRAISARNKFDAVKNCEAVFHALDGGKLLATDNIAARTGMTIKTVRQHLVSLLDVGRVESINGERNKRYWRQACR